MNAVLRLTDNLGFTDDLGITVFGFLFAVLSVIVVLVLAVFIAVTYGGRSYGRATCAHWADQTGIRTKFVVLNWADSGTCLARTPNGRWVLNSNWQAFVQAGN